MLGKFYVTKQKFKGALRNLRDYFLMETYWDWLSTFLYARFDKDQKEKYNKVKILDIVEYSASIIANINIIFLLYSYFSLALLELSWVGFLISKVTSQTPLGYHLFLR